MEKWSFNNLIFSRLPEILDISGAEIAKRCDMKQQVLNRYTTNEIVISVQTLIKICNALRIPIYYFLSDGNKCAIPNRESATIAVDYWHPIQWDEDAVEQTFGDNGIYWKDVARVMGVTSQKPHERFLLHTRFPVTDFLTVCNHFHLSPFNFLIDNNREQVERDTSRRTTQHEIQTLRRQVATLSSNITELTAKYEALIERHNNLEQMVRQYLEPDSK